MKLAVAAITIAGLCLTVVTAEALEPAPVTAFLQEYCWKCHGPDKQQGELALHRLDADYRTGPDRPIWSRVLEKLTHLEMPPAGERVPDNQTRERVTGWIRRQLERGSSADASRPPAFGNQVPHEWLFGGPPTAVSKSPPRLWRIRPRAYQEMLHEIAGHSTAHPFAAPFGLAEEPFGVRDAASPHPIDEPTFQLLLGNATAVATLMTTAKIERGRFTGANNQIPDELLAILDPANRQPTDAQLAVAVSRQFNRVLLRDPTGEEQQRLVAFTRDAMDRVGRLRGVRNMLSAVLLTPEALFRSEIGDEPPDEHGRVFLSSRELAYAIATALTDRRPDAALLREAEQGTLARRERVGKHVQRMLDDPSITQPRILQFFREYFGYGAAIDVFKDAQSNAHHDAQVLVNDTDQLVLYILDRDDDVLRELLTTNLSFVNHIVDASGKPQRHTGRFAHRSYNLPHQWEWTDQQPLELSAAQRGGILSQPSWLVAHSDNFNNHAIRRGKWIRERLLGGTVADLPITVDAQLTNDDQITLRSRMQVTRQAYCWTCHRSMDPLGLPWEQFDHFGRWRSHELGEAVVTTGRIDESGEAALDGPVGDPIEMVHKLAASPRVRQVFVRHAFRYWLGRHETPDDAASLQRADRAYLESGGSMKSLIRSLLTSDSFLYRDTVRADPR